MQNVITYFFLHMQFGIPSLLGGSGTCSDPAFILSLLCTDNVGSLLCRAQVESRMEVILEYLTSAYLGVLADSSPHKIYILAIVSVQLSRFLWIVEPEEELDGLALAASSLRMRNQPYRALTQ